MKSNSESPQVKIYHDNNKQKFKSKYSEANGNKKRPKNHNTLENRIRLRAYFLWQESPDYHYPEYYWEKAKNQISVEDSMDVYKPYSPRKWLFLINQKFLRPFSKKLNKNTVILILERIAVLTVFFGIVTFFWEENQRHNEIIVENWKILSEAVGTSETSNSTSTPAQNTVIKRTLEQLNREYPGISPLFNAYYGIPFLDITDAWQLIVNIFENKPIYNYHEKDKKCENKSIIQRLAPRWNRENLSELKLSKNITLYDIGLCSAKLKKAKLNGVYLNGAKLAGADLQEAELRATKLEFGDLRNVNFISADLSNTDFTSADLTDAKLLNANLSGANLTDANLTDADLRSVNLLGANLNKIEPHNLTKSQLKLACNWDKANYIFRQTEDEKWELDAEANQQYTKQIEQDKASDPQTPVDCSEWDEESVAQ